ncbi:MAG TPA: nicotinamide mononucleotide transporter [Candidatus Nanoarchaeia archaeon]|nr:nicotinamide mononucleotide transporter [Candidatus Nanoarchaeia archaeon]
MKKSQKEISKERFYSRHVIEKRLRHHILEWIATAGSLTGFTLVAMQLRIGFAIWLFANILWIGFSYHHKHWGLFFLSSCYLLINIYGYITWA